MKLSSMQLDLLTTLIRGFGDIHYDTQVSDLSTGNPQNEASINGATQDVTGQQSKDLFQGNLIGVIKDAEVIYDQARLTGDNTSPIRWVYLQITCLLVNAQQKTSP